MIQGPLSGAAVATNVTQIATKAPTTSLTTAEASITAHTGETGALQSNVNGLGSSFYTKTLTDAILSDKQATITDGSLSILKTSGLQTVIDQKQPIISTATFTRTLTPFTTPLACHFDLGCADLTCNPLYGPAIVQITAAISATLTEQGVSTPSWESTHRIFMHPGLAATSNNFGWTQTTGVSLF